MTTPTRPQRTTNRAALLLGPTGSGKTPLGDIIAQRGLWGANCRHFDFGANLRAIVQRNRPDHLISQQDIDFLGQVLEARCTQFVNPTFTYVAKVPKRYLSTEQ